MDALDSRVIRYLFAMMYSPQAVESRYHAARLVDSARSWVDPNGYRLSDRVWNARRDVRRRIDNRIRQAIASGEDALDAAKAIEQWLTHDLIPTRVRGGAIFDDGRPGVLTRTPRSGPGSYSARRLMRTEVTRVAGLESLEIGDALDLDMTWKLSNRHPEIDICDDYASGHSPGKPPGVYTRADLPGYPPHPHCLCLVTTYDDMTDDELLDHLRAKYGLPARTTR